MHRDAGDRRGDEGADDAMERIEPENGHERSAHGGRKRKRGFAQAKVREAKSRFCCTMLNCLPLMATKNATAELSFEKAMERLEAIVEEMESGKMLLEDLLVRYEEGMKLVKICQERLSRAEQKIEIITRDHAGKVAVKDFEAAETPSAAAPGDAIERKEKDEVSLF